MRSFLTLGVPMHTSESDLCLLTTCADPAEASTLRALLDSDDIDCVVQGEHHSGMLGPALGGAIIDVRVLVARKNLERALALLNAQVETPEQRAAALAAGVEEEAPPPCPVHGEVSTGVCSGCDTFLCAHCDAPGEPPLCEDCQEHKNDAPGPRWDFRRKRVGWVTLGFMFGPGLLAGVLG